MTIRLMNHSMCHIISRGACDFCHSFHEVKVDILVPLAPLIVQRCQGEPAGQQAQKPRFCSECLLAGYRIMLNDR